MTTSIKFFDLKEQYKFLKQELDLAIQQVVETGIYIGGAEVKKFETALATYLNVNHVITCANGTDALQLALMSLNLPKSSKIIVPAFTYIAPIEVVTFLGYEIIYADVCPNTFNINLENIKAVYTTEVKAIIAVHLFGQPITEINAIASFCDENNCHLIEDNAQSLGAIQHNNRNSIITTSFFPTKNLGCFGDGGAVFCNDSNKASIIRQLAQHGQPQKYIHNLVGINSRLDALQAAILNVKLNYLHLFIKQRKAIAERYIQLLQAISAISLPKITQEHSFHQYVIRVHQNQRDNLRKYLTEQGIETMVYYEMPAYKQQAYIRNEQLETTEKLCVEVLALPIYPELPLEHIDIVCQYISHFFSNK